jgi:phosphatidate cytidylyltransferase
MFSNNTNIRLLSALFLIPVVVIGIMMGGWVFGGLMGLTFAIAYAEWVQLCKATNRTLIYISVGTIYFLISFSEFIYLRLFLDNGVYLTLLCVFIMWGSDTGGYILGKKIGGPLMSPTISPKKTWAGMAGAVIGASLVFTLGLYIAPFVTNFIPNTISPTLLQLPLFIIVGAVLGYVGQIGDLLISSLKRKAHAKDSGHLIPGHGGILDRIDSLLLVIPIFVIVARYVAQ